MRQGCDAREDYLADLLGSPRRAAFEDHLAECPDCAREVQTARALDAALRAHLAAQTPSPGPSAARRLREAVGSASATGRFGASPGRTRALAMTASLALAAAAVFALLVGRREAPVEASRPGPPAAPAGEADEAADAPEAPRPLALEVLALEGAAARPARAAPTLEVGAAGRLVVSRGGDVIAAGPRTRLELPRGAGDDVTLALQRGTVVVDAAERGPGETLTVHARGVRVRVVGTRFGVRVEDAAVLVTVTEGAVEVQGPGGEAWRVGPGEQVRVGRGAPVEALSEPEAARMRALLSLDARTAEASPGGRAEGAEDAEDVSARRRSREAAAAPSLEEIRGWLLTDALERAERALVARVRARPRDADAWWLLGEARRRGADAPGALRAYARVVAVGSDDQANRARFQIARLRQEALDDPSGAASALRDYLRHRPAPLASMARLRLARALTRLGRRDEADDVLAELVRRDPASNEARRARQMLERTAPD